jgi:hypothetical protein
MILDELHIIKERRFFMNFDIFLRFFKLREVFFFFFFFFWGFFFLFFLKKKKKKTTALVNIKIDEKSSSSRIHLNSCNVTDCI